MKLARCLLCMFLLFAATGVWAQSTTGDIAGTVTDASGAVVPNATVTITNTDRNQVTRTVTTSSDGSYSAPLLPIGHYSVKVEAAGFNTYTQTGIVLNVGDKLTVSMPLKVGAAGQQVTVEATANEVQTQSPQAQALISGTQVRELGLNGRNWEQLMTLSPGVSQADNNDQIYVGNFAPQGTNIVAFSMNGARREHNNYMVDGADNVDRGSNITLLSFPSVESIAEFKVIRGQYDPEYGRAAGGQVNVVTRGGTSQLHGNVYEFFRNDALNARPFASKYPTLTSHIPYLRYNNFGGTIGGPIYIPKIYEQTNKTFFFFSEEVRRNLTYTNATATIPTAPMLTGQFTHPVCVTFNADNSCASTATSVGAINPLAKAYINDIFSKFPTPNNGVFGFTSTLRNVFNYREELIRIDHNFSQKVTVYGKILRDTIPTIEAGGLFTGVVIPGVGTTSTNSPGHQYNLRATLSLSPSLLIEPGYNYSFGAIVSDPVGLTSAASSPSVMTAAASILPFKSALNRVPNASFTGGSTVGSFGQYRDYNRNHTAFTNATWIRGTHTLKFGVTYYHYNKSENAGGGNAGSFAFNANGQPSTATFGTTSFEQSWANFLLGRVATFSQASADLTADIKDNQLEYYGQDTWRIRPNVTLSFGARHSLFRQPTDGNNLLSQFDPSLYDPAKAPCVTSTGALDISINASGVVSSACNPNYSRFNGVIFTGNPPAGGLKSPYGTKVGKEYNVGIAPRIGIAWDPWNDGRTSIRAGWGLFYDNGIIFGNAENDVFQGTGIIQNLSVTNTTVSSTTTGSCPTGTVGTAPNCISTAAPRLQSRIPIDYKYPYTNQWSLDIQREIFRGWIMDIGYYGNVGKRLPGFYDINQPPENSWRNCTVATPCYGGPVKANAVNFFNNASTASAGATTNVPAGYYVGTGNTARLNALRPYIGWNGADAVRNMYDSNYHGLQTQLQKQFKGNSLINIAYTWSHTLTTYQADRSTGSIMPLQGHIKDNNYGPGIGDRRHVLTANFVWDLPWFATQQGFAGHLLGGWEVSGIQTFQTGLPATIASDQLYDPTGAGCLGPSPCSFRANQVGDPNIGQPKQYENWFNASAFTNPGLVFGSSCGSLSGTAVVSMATASLPAGCTSVMQQSTLPTARPGSLRLPGYWRTDMSLFKNLKFTERFKGQFRFETFNTFNHTNPICCNSFTTSSSTFNRVRSARDPRVMQVALKLSF